MTLTGDPSPLVLAQRYRIEERIGAGSMGAVWRATDQLLGRVVAVKQLLLHPGAPGFDDKGYEEAKQRILREGRLAARLQHPHTISVFDVVLHDDAPWLVMEYLPSRTLGALLDAEGPIDPLRAASIGTQIADGLAAAHAAGIVHRDIKPGNVLIGADGKVKITDFGVSRAADDVQLTRTGMIAGTPAFLAPEIARGRTPTSAADVFALGSTLYASVEGLPPFGLDDNAYALLYAVGEGKVTPPTQAGALAEPLMRMLRKEPTERPSAAQVRDELAAIAAGRPVPAPAPSAEPLILPTRSTRLHEASPDSPASRAKTPTKIDMSPVGAVLAAAPVPPADLDPAASGTSVSGTPASNSPVSGTPGAGGMPPVRTPAARSRPANPATALAHSLRAARLPSLPWSASPRTLLLGASVVLVLLVGAALVLVGHRAGEGGPAVPSASPSGASAPSRAPVSGTPTAAQLEDFVRDYYGLLPGNPEAAWAMLGPRARSESGGFEQYQGFYQTIGSISFAAGPTASDSRTVHATLRFQPKNGGGDDERYQFTVVPDAAGKLIMESFSRG